MKIWHRLLDLVYPPVCGLCSQEAKGGLCASCDQKIGWYEGVGCLSCGAGPHEGVCPACSGKGMGFRSAVALGAYSGLLRRIVLSVKLRGEPLLIPSLSERLAERVRSARVRVDLVTFVPTSPFRAFYLRYPSVTEVFADSLGRTLKKPVRRSLRKTRRTVPQTDLRGDARRENLKGAFRASRMVEDRSILLVDDVLTTGATAQACARALYRARAREVHVAVLARRIRIQK